MDRLFYSEKTSDVFCSHYAEKKIEKATIAVILELRLTKIQIGKSRHHHNAIIIENFVSKCFPFTLNSKAGVFKLFRF